MSKRAYRTFQSLLLLLTMVVLVVTFYFQYVGGLQPCPLCLMQRFCAFLLAMFCLMGMCLSTLKRGRSVAIFQIVFAVAGLFFATRHVWLQSLPADQAPVCLPGLDVLIHYFPLHDVLHSLLWGAGFINACLGRTLFFNHVCCQRIYIFPASSFFGSSVESIKDPETASKVV